MKFTGQLFFLVVTVVYLLSGIVTRSIYLNKRLGKTSGCLNKIVLVAKSLVVLLLWPFFAPGQLRELAQKADSEANHW